MLGFLRLPKYPPALLHGIFSAPATLWKRAMASIKKARSRKKKSRKKATVDRNVHISSMVVKMNQPMRKKPKALLKSLGPLPVGAPEASVVAYSATISNPPGVSTIAREIQKPP